MLLPVLLSLFAVALSLDFRVLTFNIANYDDHGNWTERLEMLFELISTSGADMVALQEPRFNPNQKDTKSSYQNQAEQILYRLASDGFYSEAWERHRILKKQKPRKAINWKYANMVNQPTMYYPIGAPPVPVVAGQDPEHPDGVLFEGAAIISDRKILETGTRFFVKSKACEDASLRALQFAAVDLTSDELAENNDQDVAALPLQTPSNDFYLFNAHFGLGEQCLTENVAQTLQYVSLYEQRSPILVVGDLNAEPTQLQLKSLAAHGLVDLWAQLYPNKPGFTFPSNAPIKRIDYGWANQILAKKLQTIEMIGGQPSSDGTYASDHLALLFTFKF